MGASISNGISNQDWMGWRENARRQERSWWRPGVNSRTSFKFLELPNRERNQKGTSIQHRVWEVRWKGNPQSDLFGYMWHLLWTCSVGLRGWDMSTDHWTQRTQPTLMSVKAMVVGGPQNWRGVDRRIKEQRRGKLTCSIKHELTYLEEWRERGGSQKESKIKTNGFYCSTRRKEVTARLYTDRDNPAKGGKESPWREVNCYCSRTSKKWGSWWRRPQSRGPAWPGGGAGEAGVSLIFSLSESKVGCWLNLERVGVWGRGGKTWTT